MKKLVLMSVVLFLALGVAPSMAGSYGVLTGQVGAKAYNYGSGGMTNSIELTFNTGDGITWVLICRRSKSNLGLCDNASANTTYEATGTFSSNTVLELETLAAGSGM